MPDLWSLCREGLNLVPLGGELLRLVESQEQVATSTLVDDLAEQAVLEDLLEATKPPPRPGTAGLHYLLATPFRYPPLRYGSRFGGRFEPSLFYGSRGLTTVLAEAAYYRFVFWTAMATPPPSGRLVTQHSLLRARYRGSQGVRLTDPPCAAQAATLTHPSDYGPTQDLGRALRAAGVEVIEFASARDPGLGRNVALFEPSALVSRRPLSLHPWLCETRAGQVSFSADAGRALHAFSLDLFLVDGLLPRPAA
jgi:hypothetical protein